MTETTGSSPQRVYDVVVIGGGPVGENVVDRTRRAGLSTLLVERELVGGECSYWACVPSKTLLRPGALLAETRGVPEVAAVVTGRPDPAATFRRRDYEVSSWSDAGQLDWLESVSVDFVRGSARFTGPKVLEIEQDGTAVSGAASVRVEARRAVVVATGSEPVVPPVPGLAEARPWTSREATAAHTVPDSLVVIGGGVVAVELACAYADFGSEVTMLVRGDRLLAGVEPFAAEQVLVALRDQGVRVELGVEVTGAHRGPGGVQVGYGRGHAGEAPTGEGPRSVTASEVLVAAGRRPRTSDLGLETLGLEPGEPLAVDDALCVTAVEDGWLFAVGDVTRRTGTTHQGKYGARIVGEVIAARFAPESEPHEAPHEAPHQAAHGVPHEAPQGEPSAPVGARRPRLRPGAEDRDAWGPHRATADLVGQPQVIFSRPEVAAVGWTLAQAEAKGLPVRAIDHDIASVSGAYLKADDYAGRARLVVDTEREVVVGATFTGPDAAELLHAATVAVVGEVPLRRLWHAVPSFPTVSEIWLRLLEDYGF